ncbi:MAG: hypothetical protein ACRDJU_09530, partial [Actinomycetota bacterium]
VTRVTSLPRWMYSRLAVVVSGVLLLPDVYLLVRGQPLRAVAVLMAMHLAIAAVTYAAVIHLAPVRRRRQAAGRLPDEGGAAKPARTT